MKEQLGFGVGVDNPEGFIRAVIAKCRWFGFEPAEVGITKPQLVQEGRVAVWLTEEHRRQQGLPMEGENYIKSLVAAICRQCRYHVATAARRGVTAGGEKRRFTPVFSELEAPNSDDNHEFAEDQAVGAGETAPWFKNQMGIAEAILLQHKRAGQGEKDAHIFRLWVLGNTPEDIASQCPWLESENNKRSVQDVLERCILKLRDYYGTDTKLPIFVGEHSHGNARGRDRSLQGRRDYQKQYYEQHKEVLKARCRENQRKLRQKRRAAKQAAQQREEQGVPSC